VAALSQSPALSELSAVSELFDTNILVDHLKGIAKATREIKASDDPAISIVTWIEVMAGATTVDEEVRLKAFLANFESLPVTGPVAERAAAIRRVKHLKMPDAIILATAEVAGRVLVTRDGKAFPAGTRGVSVLYETVDWSAVNP
jgi:predicted nucleic acid-binding protein